MLVGIVLTHLPTRASHYANQMLGFISWAEGFVLISAVVGRVYGNVLRQRLRALVKQLGLRSAKLYGYHIPLGVAFTIIAAVQTQEPALLGLLDFYPPQPPGGCGQRGTAPILPAVTRHFADVHRLPSSYAYSARGGTALGMEIRSASFRSAVVCGTVRITGIRI
jgi:hypothetical protein